MRHEKRIKRDDGAIIKLVTIGHLSVFTRAPEIDMFAVVRDPATSQDKYYYPTLQEKNLGGLSVVEYVQKGRKGLLSVVRPHEIIGSILDVREMLGA